MRELFSLKNQHSIVPLCGFEVSRVTKGAPCSACVSPPEVDWFSYYGGGGCGSWPYRGSTWNGVGYDLGPTWNHDIVLNTDNMIDYAPPGSYSYEEHLNNAKVAIENFNERRMVYTYPVSGAYAYVSDYSILGACGCTCQYGVGHCGTKAKLSVEITYYGNLPYVPAEAHYNEESKETISDGTRTLYIKLHYRRVDIDPYPGQTPTECYFQYRNFGWECWKVFPETFTLTLIKPPV